MKSSLIVTLLCVVSPMIAGIPAPEAVGQDQCAKEMRNAGVSDKFVEAVAHAIHSLTVDELKKFDPSVTEMNYVPTVNMDLLAKHAILPYAPDAKTKDTDFFLTDGMKGLDMVFSHMDNKHYGLSGFNSMEQLVHEFHMREIWAQIKVEFDKIGKTKPVPSPQACKCVMDIDNNGLKKQLRLVALSLREPGLIFGDPEPSDSVKADDDNKKPVLTYYKPPSEYPAVDNPVKTDKDNKKPVLTYYNPPSEYPAVDNPVKTDGGNKPVTTYYYHPATGLVSEKEKGLQGFNDEAGWSRAKEDLKGAHNDDVALFLYCALAKGKKGAQ